MGRLSVKPLFNAALSFGSGIESRLGSSSGPTQGKGVSCEGNREVSLGVEGRSAPGSNSLSMTSSTRSSFEPSLVSPSPAAVLVQLTPLCRSSQLVKNY